MRSARQGITGSVEDNQWIVKECIEVHSGSVLWCSCKKWENTYKFILITSFLLRAWITPGSFDWSNNRRKTMAKEFAKRFYKSKQWQRTRDAYIAERVAIDGGMCEVCGKRLGYIVHHKNLLTAENINDAAVTTDDLLYVCKHCHDLIHDPEINGSDTARIAFDKDGNVISVDEMLKPPLKSK